MFDIETEAISGLVSRMKAMRKRIALPFVIVGAILGQVGLLAHATGYWSVLGVLPDNTYFVNKITIALAFVMPALPIFALGFPSYLWMRARTRRMWRDEYLAQGLSDEWLERTTHRFP